MKLSLRYPHPLRITGRWIVPVLLAALLAWPFTATAQMISDECAACHNDQYQQWKASGHPFKLMEGVKAQNRPIPLPEGYTWDEISYVIGGYKWKSRYMDQNGYIITQGKGDEPGDTQYNMLTGEWVDYHADEPNGTRPYNCGSCHTTGWVANDNPDDTSGNQDGLAGLWGKFEAGGIQCIACHGGAQHADFGMVDDSAEACGTCHHRTAAPGETNVIPASGGFIKHHEQYNEFLASGAHGENMECTTCHNPHMKSEFSIKDGKTCEDCHTEIAASYATTTMYDYQVACNDCHMPLATKSGQVTGPFQGDVKTHIFRINSDAGANMFTEDGAFVALDGDGNAAVTMDFACQRCHETATLDELSKFAKDFHDPDVGNTHVGLTSGLSGVWWGGSSRNGEGFVLSFENDPNGNLYLFASVYTYDDMGNQAYLIGTSNSFDGMTVNIDVYITSGRKWGADYDPADGATVAWGTGTFTFPDCENGTMTLTPNADALASGFTEISYPLSRDVGDLAHGITCPTFVNNAAD